MPTKSNDEYVEEFINHPGNGDALSAWLRSTLEAKDREIEKREVEILATITALQQSLDNAPLSFPQDMDITEVPDGLAHELRGMKKGWHAALEQVKLALSPTLSSNDE